ncbi:DNA internalization-related competence protein ComEC/Rec2 [bacterium]|nr:DNA internalization-related competence protein ComEC/Rec2 [bacterium]
MSWQWNIDTHSDIKERLPRPLFSIALAWMSGIVFARFFPVPMFPVFLTLILLSLCGFLMRKSEPVKKTIWYLILILAFLFSMARTEISFYAQKETMRQVEQIAQSGVVSISGTIEEISKKNHDECKILLGNVQAVQNIREWFFPGKVEVVFPSPFSSFRMGDRLQVEGKLTPVRGPKLPLRFPYQAYQYSRQVLAVVYIDSDIRIQRWAAVGFSPIRGLAYAAMQKIEETWPLTKRRAEAIGLLGSMTLGIRSATPPKLKERLMQSGLAHLTSISGLHVTLVLVSLAYGLKWIGFRRRSAAVLVGVLSILYLFMVGPRIPTLRAVMMAYVILGSYFIERPFSPLNSLGLAAVILLIADPTQLFQASFQLSFAAVLILLLFRPMLTWLNETIRIPLLNRVAQGMFASTAVVIGLIPFITHMYPVWSWGAILGNLLAIPVVSVLLPLTYVWLFLLQLPAFFLTDVVGIFINLLVLSLLNIIELTSLPIFHLPLPFPGFALSSLGLFAFFLFSRPMLPIFERRSFHFRGIHLSLTLFFILTLFPFFSHSLSPLRIDFPALGQGDCILIRTPKGANILVDGGPPPSPHAAHDPLLTRFLHAQQIKTIDLMVLTHPQADHIGCLKAVLQQFSVRFFIESVPDPTNKSYCTLKERLKIKNIPIHQARSGDWIKVGKDITLWVLHPDKQAIERNKDINENSVVLFLKTKQLDLMLTGDIGKETETALCRNNDNWHADILKVPHHGSRLSSSRDFIAEIQPRFAVIQAGKNRYGHPHQETCERYQSQHIHVLRTDIDGTVRVTSWKEQYRMYTTLSNQLYIARHP